MICEYGCEKEANFQLRNGKWCCCEHFTKCSAFIKRANDKKKGRSWEILYGVEKAKEMRETVSVRMKENNPMKNVEPWNKGKGKPKVEKEKRNIFGKNNPMYGRQHSEEAKEKMRLKRLGNIPWNKNRTGLQTMSEKEKERCRQFMINGHSEYMNSFPKPKMSEKTKEKHRKRMLVGGAIKALQGVKKISKQELILRELVKKIFPDCSFQYKVLNYALDVAIPKYKIAIEYDGYFHFNNEKNIEYHKYRQKMIEQEGWLFLRYDIYSKLPIIEKLIEDLGLLIRRRDENI